MEGTADSTSLGASMITLTYPAELAKLSPPRTTACCPMRECSESGTSPWLPWSRPSSGRGPAKTILRGLLGLAIGLVLGLVMGLLSGAALGALLGVLFEGPDSTVHTAAAIAVMGLVCGGMVGIVLGFLMGLGVSLGRAYVGAVVGVVLGAVIGAFLGGTIGLAIIGLTGAVGGAAIVMGYRLVTRYIVKILD